MANIDIPIKRLMQSRISDWIQFVIPDCEEKWIKEMDASKAPAKKESRLDKLIMVESPKEKYIINIEPQGYFDSKLPARMLRYRADIWEYTLEMKLGIPSIKQAVIFFFKNHDNGKYGLYDRWDTEETLKFSYKPIKLWDIEKSEIIKRNLQGLFPLLPLMKAEEYETDEEIMNITIERISSVKDEAIKSDLLAVMSILAGEKFTVEFVKKFIRREMLMQSELFKEWIEEDIKKASVEKGKKNLIELLAEKFDFVPKGIRTKILEFDDEELIDELFKKSIKIQSIEEFNELLKRASSSIE